jgi:hypothetical protein
MLREVEVEAEGPAGNALVMNVIRMDASNFSRAVAGSMPCCVCPKCEGNGVLGTKSPCPVCVFVSAAAKGEGWLCRMRFRQLTPDLKRKAESWSGADPAGQGGQGDQLLHACAGRPGSP